MLPSGLMTADIIADILYVHFEHSANHNVLRKRANECPHAIKSPSVLIYDDKRATPSQNIYRPQCTDMQIMFTLYLN